MIVPEIQNDDSLDRELKDCPPAGHIDNDSRKARLPL